MDRQFAYSGAIPLDTDLLLTNKDSYIGLAKLSSGILGTNTLLNGLSCVPTSPATMSVNINPGEMYSLQNIDNSAYGNVAPDTSHQILKQGILLNASNIPISAPLTVGYSQNYLIEIAFNEVDGGSTVLQYYNASNPTSPWSGPGNTGAANNTVRQDTITITAKAGAAAPTGTQTTPTPDANYVGAFVVTVTYGQTQITSGNISAYTGTGAAVFLTETLIQKISQITADARYAQITQVQNNSFNTGTDSGTANALVVTLSPAITSYVYGMNFNIKVANTNTGPSTIAINGLATKNIVHMDGSALTQGQLLANAEHNLIYNGTAFQLMNPANPSMISSVIAQASSISLVNNTSANITSINCPTGTWDIRGNVFSAVSVQQAFFYGWTSTTSASSIPDESLIALASSTNLIGNTGLVVPTLRYTFSTPTTVYLTVQSQFASGTNVACGGIYALPVRIS